MPRICPYGSHIYVFAGQSLPIWDLYRSYMGKKAYMGPMQDPNGINAQILPIWVPYIHVCWVVSSSGVLVSFKNVGLKVIRNEYALQEIFDIMNSKSMQTSYAPTFSCMPLSKLNYSSHHDIMIRLYQLSTRKVLRPISAIQLSACMHLLKL